MGEENQSDFNQNYTNGQELDTQDTAAEDIPLETATDKNDTDPSEQAPGESAVAAVETNTNTPPEAEPPVHIASIDHTENEGSKVAEPTALDMAYAGNPYRSKAAVNRETNQLFIDRQAESASLSDFSLPIPKSSLRHPFERSRNNREFNRRFNALQAHNKELAHRDREEQDEALDLGQGYYESKSPAERAAFYDKRAEQVETWAGILHDHPISQAYIESHKGVDLSPEGLVRLEELTQALAEDDVDKNETAAGEEAEDIIKLGNEPEYVFSMLDNADQATYEEYQRIQSDLETVLAAKAQLVKKLYTKTYVDPIKNRVALSQSLLEDIKSGRASQ